MSHKVLWARLGLVGAIGAAALIGGEMLSPDKKSDAPEIGADFNAAATHTVQTADKPAPIIFDGPKAHQAPGR